MRPGSMRCWLHEQQILRDLARASAMRSVMYVCSAHDCLAVKQVLSLRRRCNPNTNAVGSVTDIAEEVKHVIDQSREKNIRPPWILWYDDMREP